MLNPAGIHGIPQVEFHKPISDSTAEKGTYDLFIADASMLELNSKSSYSSLPECVAEKPKLARNRSASVDGAYIRAFSQCVTLHLPDSSIQSNTQHAQGDKRKMSPTKDTKLRNRSLSCSEISEKRKSNNFQKKSSVKSQQRHSFSSVHAIGHKHKFSSGVDTLSSAMSEVDLGGYLASSSERSQQNKMKKRQYKIGNQRRGRNDIVLSSVSSSSGSWVTTLSAESLRLKRLKTDSVDSRSHSVEDVALHMHPNMSYRLNSIFENDVIPGIVNCSPVQRKVFVRSQIYSTDSGTDYRDSVNSLPSP